jgi:hypothetical protein
MLLGVTRQYTSMAIHEPHNQRRELAWAFHRNKVPAVEELDNQVGMMTASTHNRRDFAAEDLLTPWQAIRTVAYDVHHPDTTRSVAIRRIAVFAARRRRP